MSRRGRHGRHPHAGPGARPVVHAPGGDRPPASVDARQALPLPVRPSPVEARPGQAFEPHTAGAEDGVAPPPERPAPAAPAPVSSSVPVAPTPVVPPAVAVAAPAGVHAVAEAQRPAFPERQALVSAGHGLDESRSTCTVAQLRRFIKSRPWIPLHELRWRFGITGEDDDVTPIRVGEHVLFIGLPPVEGRLVAELLGAGDVGYELSLDPGAPVVVGVYPMRPIPRG